MKRENNFPASSQWQLIRMACNCVQGPYALHSKYRGKGRTLFYEYLEPVYDDKVSPGIDSG